MWPIGNCGCSFMNRSRLNETIPHWLINHAIKNCNTPDLVPVIIWVQMSPIGEWNPSHPMNHFRSIYMYSTHTQAHLAHGQSFMMIIMECRSTICGDRLIPNFRDCLPCLVMFHFDVHVYDNQLTSWMKETQLPHSPNLPSKERPWEWRNSLGIRFSILNVTETWESGKKARKKNREQE